MNQVQSAPATRPVSITVICALGFLGAGITVPLIFSPMSSAIGSWYPPYLGLVAVVGLICMIGLWHMKRWAAYGYTGLAVVNQVVLLAMGAWGIMALIIPAIIVFFALKHAPQMT